jgi:hypothetical protein
VCRVFEAPATLGIRIVKQKIQPQEGRGRNEDEADLPGVPGEKSSPLSPFCSIVPVTEAEKSLLSSHPFSRSTSWDKLKTSILSIGSSKSHVSGKEEGASPGVVSKTMRTSFSSSDLSARVIGGADRRDDAIRGAQSRDVLGTGISRSGSNSGLLPGAAAAPVDEGRCSVYSLESRVLWLMGNAPEGVVVEGLSAEEEAREQTGEDEEEDEDDLFYDSFIERYHGKLSFDEDEEDEEEEGDAGSVGSDLRASTGTVDSHEHIGSNDDLLAAGAAHSSLSGGDCDCDGFRGNRDKGVIYAPHSAWRGGYCNDVTALLRCSRSSSLVSDHGAEKGVGGGDEEGDVDPPWIDVWKAIPQHRESYLSEGKGFGVAVAEGLAGEQGVGKRHVVEVEDMSRMIPLVRDRGDPKGGSWVSTDRRHKVTHRGDGRDALSAVAMGYRWALQIVQLCDSPLQESRSIMANADGDVDGLVVVCSVSLDDDWSKGKDANSYSIRIRADDATGLVSCALLPVDLSEATSEGGEVRQAEAGNGRFTDVDADDDSSISALQVLLQLFLVVVMCATSFVFLRYYNSRPAPQDLPFSSSMCLLPAGSDLYESETCIHSSIK